MSKKQDAEIRRLVIDNNGATGKEYVIAMLREIISDIERGYISPDKALVLTMKNDLNYLPLCRNCGMDYIEIIGICNYISIILATDIDNKGI